MKEIQYSHKYIIKRYIIYYKTREYKEENSLEEGIVSKAPPCNPKVIVSNGPLIELDKHATGHGPLHQPTYLTQV